MPVIAFIGAGNMATALIRGLLANGVRPEDIRAADPSAAQREAVASSGITVCTDNSEAVAGADVVVLAVKPQVLGEVVRGLKGLAPQSVVLSIAAGVSLGSLTNWLPAGQPVVRCMPNTPALLGAGITAAYANDAVSQGARSTIATLLEGVGRMVWVDAEADLDAVTAVSGSGPAYFFYMMEAMIDAGAALGLPRQTVVELVIETAYGAALMARQGDTDPATLRRNVTSPGGTTERALNLLQAGDFHATIMTALEGAARRSEELAKEFGS